MDPYHFIDIPKKEITKSGKAEDSQTKTRNKREYRATRHIKKKTKGKTNTETLT